MVSEVIDPFGKKDEEICLKISLLSKGLKFIPTPKHIIKLLLRKNLKPMVENVDLCGIITMKKKKLSILLRKNQNLILNKKMPP